VLIHFLLQIQLHEHLIILPLLFPFQLDESLLLLPLLLKLHVFPLNHFLQHFLFLLNQTLLNLPLQFEYFLLQLLQTARFLQFYCFQFGLYQIVRVSLPLLHLKHLLFLFPFLFIELL
jgi:hypothetical protein